MTPELIKLLELIRQDEPAVLAALGLDASITAGTTLIILPSVDPEVEGALWNDAGTITVSAGA